MKQQAIPPYVIDKVIKPYESLRDSIENHLSNGDHNLFYDFNAPISYLYEFLPQAAEDINRKYIKENPSILPPEIRELYEQEISTLEDSINNAHTEIERLRGDLTLSQNINYGGGSLWLILIALLGYKTLRKKLKGKND